MNISKTIDMFKAALRGCGQLWIGVNTDAVYGSPRMPETDAGETLWWQKEVHVSTITQGPVTRAPTPRAWTALLTATEMWASIAIAIIWIAVLFSAVYGPNLVSHSSDGSSTTIPSGIGVALFAAIATWAIAKHAFGRGARNAD